jgi:hypothetical protein
VAGIDRVIDVGERLRLDALRGIDHQQRALAGRERAVHLVGEVDMPGRVDQVEDVVLAVARAVVQPHGLRLDGDAALALDVHRVEHLLLAGHLARVEPAGELDQPVGERRLAVVDMRDDREIADIVDWLRRHARQITPALQCGKRGGGARDFLRCAGRELLLPSPLWGGSTAAALLRLSGWGSQDSH